MAVITNNTSNNGSIAAVLRKKSELRWRLYTNIVDTNIEPGYKTEYLLYLVYII